MKVEGFKYLFAFKRLSMQYSANGARRRMPKTCANRLHIYFASGERNRNHCLQSYYSVGNKIQKNV